MKVNAVSNAGCLSLYFENNKLEFRNLIFDHYLPFVTVDCTQPQAMRFMVELFEYVVKPTEPTQVFKVGNRDVEVTTFIENNVTMLAVRFDDYISDSKEKGWHLFSRYQGNPVLEGLRSDIITQLSFS